MNKILKLALILFMISAIVAGVLGVVNELTKDRIWEINNQKTIEAFALVLPAEGYTEVEFDKAAFASVDNVNKANGGEGYVVQETVSGAQGMITMVVGVDSDYKCSGISIIEHSETSGLGANAASSSEIGQNFRAQFIGEDENIALSKAGGNIDALAGATITSRAVTNAVATAIQVAKSVA